VANPEKEQVAYPFTAFNFAVEIKVDGVAMQVVDAAFAECDGLEMTMDVKTIREGGNNGRQIRLTGPLTFGQVTMKRSLRLEILVMLIITMLGGFLVPAIIGNVIGGVVLVAMLNHGQVTSDAQ